MPSTFCIVALIVFPAMVRMVFTIEDDPRLLKEVSIRNGHGAKITPFMFREIRDSSEDDEEQQTDSEQQKELQQQQHLLQQSQSPGVERLWSRNINRDHILNTVLAQLQQKNSRLPISELWNENTDYGDTDESHTEEKIKSLQDRVSAEYNDNSKTTWDRGLRQSGRQKYYPICRVERSTVSLSDPEYEYRPAHYEEIRCISSGHIDKSDNTICSKAGFECMQWNETIHITRKRINSGCWESFTYTVPKGCECMWPEHRLGRIEHHQA